MLIKALTNNGANYGQADGPAAPALVKHTLYRGLGGPALDDGSRFLGR